MVTPKPAARTGQKNSSSLEQRGAEGAAKVRETVDSQCRHPEPVDLQHGVQRGQFQFAKLQHGIDWARSGRLGHSGSVSVPAGTTAQFVAAVRGTSNTAVAWKLASMDGVAAVGTINASGLYTAPPGVNQNTQVVVTATSEEDQTASAKSLA